MSLDQFSPFITLGISPDARVYEEYSNTISDPIPSPAALAMRASEEEEPVMHTATSGTDNMISAGLDTAKDDDNNSSGYRNNKNLMGEEDGISSPQSTNEEHTTDASSDSTTPTSLSLSRGPSPSLESSSASSVVADADECASEEDLHAKDDDNQHPSNVKNIALEETHYHQPEPDRDLSGPPLPPSGQETNPIAIPIPVDRDHDANPQDMFSIFTQDHNPTILSNKIITAPAQYVSSAPGKKIRAKTASALNVWLRVSEENLEQIGTVIDMLHNASLILDDVEDGSVSRRGRPATHMIFGMPQAVNSAGYQINRAMREVLKLGSETCLEIFIEELDRLYIGQGYDLFWTFNIKRPSVEKYISMVDYKTGSLFNMLVRLMTAKSGTGEGATLGNSAPDLSRLVVLLGRYFQIRDDYMNLTSDEYTLQKGFCDDLDEGKFSLTLIHALENTRSETEHTILRHVLAQRAVSGPQIGMSLAQKHLVMDIIKNAGSLEYTVGVLRKIGEEMTNELKRIETITGVENGELRGLVEVLRV